MDSSDTTATLASGNFLGIINVLMQLRKVGTTCASGSYGVPFRLPSAVCRLVLSFSWPVQSVSCCQASAEA